MDITLPPQNLPPRVTDRAFARLGIHFKNELFALFAA